MKYLVLTRGYYAKVDDEDYERLMRWKWHVNLSGKGRYGVRCVQVRPGRQQKRMLHYEVLGLEQPLADGRVVDHINHDGLDCRKANLRVCTVQQNRWNTRSAKKQKGSRYKGVTRQRPKGPFKGGWQAVIMKDGRRRYLGFFRDEYDAMVAYNRAAVRLFGDYAVVNRWRGKSSEQKDEKVVWKRIWEE